MRVNRRSSCRLGTQRLDNDRLQNKRTCSWTAIRSRRLLKSAIRLALALHFSVGSHAIAQSIDINGDTTPALPPDGILGADLLIGETGIGSLSILDGASVSNWSATLGDLVGSDGSVRVAGTSAGGTQSTWSNSGDLTIGSQGSGTLIIENGGVVSNSNATIGQEDTAVGEAIVAGEDSRWINSGRLTVGSGRLRIEDRATVTAADGAVVGSGNSNGRVSEVVVTGGAKWIITDQLGVGNYASGSLAIENGGTVSSTQGYVGASSDGVVAVTGVGSSWNNDTSITIGNYGVGTLTIADGAHVRSDGMLLGIDSGARGTLALSGSAAVRSVLETGWIFAGSGDVDVSIDGGILRATQSNDNFMEGFDSREVAIGANGAIIDTAGFDIGIAASLGGAGSLYKAGSGTLTITGVNGYGGHTFVEEGGLIGNVGSIRGNLANAGTVEFNQETDASFGGTIAGLSGVDGRMVKSGTGTLTLTGPSSLDWSVTDGNLVAAAERFDGDVSIEGTSAVFTFRQIGSANYDGAISGDGGFVIDGPSTLLLTGDSAAFSGTTTLRQGTLRVGDSSGHGRIGGSLNVLAGSTLGGSGAVGSGAGSTVTIESGATLSPGNSIGTLTVNGDLIIRDGARLEVEVNPSGNESDLVRVTGNTTLAGGAVAHVGATGEYDLSSRYTILSTQGSLTGSFGSVTSDFAFLDPYLFYDYEQGTVDLAFLRNDRSLASVAQTPNQIATAGGIESIEFGSGNAAYDAVVQLADDPSLIRNTFDALSGEVHASVASSLIEDSRFIREAGKDRVLSAFHASPDTTPSEFSHSTDLWARGLGSWETRESNGNAAEFNRSIGGVMVGADMRSSNSLLGVLTGYTRSEISVDSRRSSADIESYSVGSYGGVQWQRVILQGAAAHTSSSVATKRSIAVPGFTDHLTDDYRAGTFQAFGELAYRMPLDRGVFEPFAGVANVIVDRKGSTERGGSAALAMQGKNSDTTFTSLGARAERGSVVRGIDAVFSGMLVWRHAFGDANPESAHAFSESDVFTVFGTPIARDSAAIEAGVTFDFSREARLSIGYSGQIASGVQDHGLRVTLNTAL